MDTLSNVWQYIDLWKFLAGLGIFLFGMHYLEEALNNLAGATFKRFLRKQTDTAFKAILSGTVATAILQSSSVVTLMVLAFVGAGIITLKNALGIIIGANLGTTATGWIVATLGFKLNIETFSLPLIAIGGITLAFYPKTGKARELGRLVIGFGFLFLGLNYMKLSIDQLTGHVDLGQYAGNGPWVFFLVGFVLTAIIQSSSATMVINLSALSAGIIPLESAIALAIGSDLGTTITAMLGAIGGSQPKKQAAFSHFSFNVITAIMGLALLKPLVYFIHDVLSISDPLYALVSFHSLFNFLGIILVFPFLKPFAKGLQMLFKESTTSLAKYIPKVTPEVPDAAIDALGHEIEGLLEHIFRFNLSVFKISKELFGFKEEQSNGGGLFNRNHQDGDEYVTIKQLEGEIVTYYLKIQNQKLEDDEPERLNKFIYAVRNAMQALKGIKDVSHNIVAFERSANDQQTALLDMLRSMLSNFYLELYRILKPGDEAAEMELLSGLMELNHDNYQKFLDEIYALARSNKITQLDTSTLLNVNREVYHANRALILSVKDTVLSPADAAAFSRLQEHA